MNVTDFLVDPVVLGVAVDCPRRLALAPIHEYATMVRARLSSVPVCGVGMLIVPENVYVDPTLRPTRHVEHPIDVNESVEAPLVGVIFIEDVPFAAQTAD